jgi:ureidoacrylate peracid hydrolase
MKNARSVPALWQYRAMHPFGIRQEIIDRVIARRGRVRWFDRLEPAKTALVTLDMQGTFCAPGGPAEVPGARAIVPNINRLSAGLRRLGCPVIWVLHANTQRHGKSDWPLFFDHVVAAEVRARTLESLEPGRQQVWSGLETAADDLVLVKNRYSALVPGSSTLERVLRSLGADTILIAGTKTNVCCESTARDAMMLDFKVVLVSDCCAALSDEEHRATLETHIQQFGDVAGADEVLRLLS